MIQLIARSRLSILHFENKKIRVQTENSSVSLNEILISNTPYKWKVVQKRKKSKRLKNYDVQEVDKSLIDRN